MPIEISFGASNVRERISENVINSAPVSSVAPNSTRKSGPTRRRARCGQTSPTKLKPPPTAQQRLDIATAAAKSTTVCRDTATPKPVAI